MSRSITEQETTETRVSSPNDVNTTPIRELPSHCTYDTEALDSVHHHHVSKTVSMETRFLDISGSMTSAPDRNICLSSCHDSPPDSPPSSGISGAFHCSTSMSIGPSHHQLPTLSSLYSSSTSEPDTDGGDELSRGVSLAGIESDDMDKNKQSNLDLAHIGTFEDPSPHNDGPSQSLDILCPQLDHLYDGLLHACNNRPTDGVGEASMDSGAPNFDVHENIVTMLTDEAHHVSGPSDPYNTTADLDDAFEQAGGPSSSVTPHQYQALYHTFLQELHETLPVGVAPHSQYDAISVHDAGVADVELHSAEDNNPVHLVPPNSGVPILPWFMEADIPNMSFLGPASGLLDTAAFGGPAAGRLVNSTAFGDAQDPDEDFERNLDVCEFFEYWRSRYEMQTSAWPRVGGQATRLRDSQRPDQITISDLDGDRCDYQGINWQQLGADREEGRVIRNQTYTNYTNIHYSDDMMHGLGYQTTRNHAKQLPSSDSHFRFRQLKTQHKAHLSHFQLRNLISAPSRNCVFYAGKSQIFCVDTTLNTGRSLMNFTKPCLTSHLLPPRKVSTMTASHDVVVAGGFGGQYAMQSVLAAPDTPYTLGIITEHDNSITNHIHITPSRQSGLPLAIFSSNDDTIRVLDCHTNTFIGAHSYPWPVNCAATSPDARLRLLVGDDSYPWIVEAESGTRITELKHHRDYGFACDWAPDGIHFATGNQDGVVQVFDARNWNSPLQTIATEIGGARSIRFSPVGGGRRVLVIAEPADVVSVVDAVTWESRQRFDFLGEIGGVAITDDGGRLFVANMDDKFGGLMEFERTDFVGCGDDESRDWMGLGIRHGWGGEYLGDEGEGKGMRAESRTDWVPERELDDDARVVGMAANREWRGLELGDLVL